MIYIIFFLLLFYGTLKVLCSVLIYPAQFLKIKELDLQSIRNENLDLTIVTADEITTHNRKLKTITIQPYNDKSKGIIIVFNGQRATIRDEKKFKTYCQLARDTGYMVVGFDYGGTGLRRISTWSIRELVDDGLYLTKKIYA